MITLRTSAGTVDVSNDVFENEYISHPSEMADFILRTIQAYMCRKGISNKNIRLLHAHGHSNGNYEYREKTQLKSVNTWLNMHEKGHDALAILVCNTTGIALSKRWSYLVYPKSLCSIDDLLESATGQGRIFTILPPHSLTDVLQPKDYLINNTFSAHAKAF